MTTKYNLPPAKAWQTAAIVDPSSVTESLLDWGTHPDYNVGLSEQTTFRDYELVGDATKAMLLGSFYTSAGGPWAYGRVYRPFGRIDSGIAQGWGLDIPDLERVYRLNDTYAIAACALPGGRIFSGLTFGVGAASRAFKFTDFDAIFDAYWSAANGFTLSEDPIVTPAPNGPITSIAAGSDGILHYAYISQPAYPAVRITGGYDPVAESLALDQDYNLQLGGREVLLVGDGPGVTALWRGDSPFKAQQLALGGKHSCALLSDSSVSCWGDDSLKQVTLGGHSGPGPTAVATPTAYTPLSLAVSSIAAGGNHSCAALQSGAVMCWGENADGELGNGTTTDGYGLVTTLTAAAGVACGDTHSCALTSAGKVYCWGDNGSKQVGQAAGASFSIPQLTALNGAAAATTATKIAAGANHTCAIVQNGAVYCWGDNSSSQVGVVGAGPFSAPQLAAGITGAAPASKAVAIAAGASHTCAIVESGAVRCWGNAANNRLGAVDPGAGSATAATIANGAVDIVAGTNHTCALMNTGKVMCWGVNGSGQIGNNQIADTDPVEVLSYVLSPTVGADQEVVLTGVQQIAAGGNHSCAIVGLDRFVKCWGENDKGELGNNVTTVGQTSLPQWTRFACAADSGCALLSSRSIGGGFYDISLVSGYGLQVQSFGAASDQKGNVVATYIQEKSPAPTCSSSTTPQTVNCKYRVFGSVRNTNGTWSGPTELDTQFPSLSATSVYQDSAVVGGKNYFTPGVVYLGPDADERSKFMVVYAMINNATAVSGIYSLRYNEGQGWQESSKTRTIEQTGAIDPSGRQHRLANDFHLTGDDAGLALLSVHYRRSMNQNSGTQGIFGYKAYRYDDTSGWTKGAHLDAPYCLNTFGTLGGCDRGKPMGRIFGWGEALIIFPAPTTVGGTDFTLYSSEFR